MFNKLKLESGYFTCDYQDGKVISGVIVVWAAAKYIESDFFLETRLANYWKIYSRPLWDLANNNIEIYLKISGYLLIV